MVDAFFYTSDLTQLPETIRRHLGCVVAIGNFDGVHLGHQGVLQKARDLAQQTSRPAVVLTFEPHPRTFFNPDEPVDRLTPALAKREIFRLLGFDGVVVLDFGPELARLEAQDFIQKILVDGLGVKHVVTGENFYFGANRSGNAQFLEREGEKSGFHLHIVKPLRDETGMVISSSRVRQSLENGHVEEAGRLLGHRYHICAEVVRGNQLGRTLGFPTANMQVPEQTKLKTGIYGVRLRRASGALHDGVASFGFRPTVNEVAQPLLETFIFDFDDNLYGERCSVTFFARLRGEEKFDNLEAMIEQMHRDTTEARHLLRSAKPLTHLDDLLNFC